jgi:hypothetical protein
MLAQFSPVNKYAWLGPGHTLPCDSWQNSNHRMALLQYAHPGTARIALEKFLGDPVNVLWFVPISEVFHRPCRPATDETLGSSGLVPRRRHRGRPILGAVKPVL